MGGNYSRMPQKCSFPTGYFVIGFRQPDCLQILNLSDDMVDIIRQTLQKHWPGGTRSERRFLLGTEIRLSNEPFANDSSNIDKMVACYKCCIRLLQKLIMRDCELITNGHLIRGIERNLWIWRRKNLDEETNTSTSSKTKRFTLSVIGMEDWSKVIFVNFTEEDFSEVREEIETIWSTGITRSNFFSDAAFGVIELAGQPWDSYKNESEKTPSLVLRLIEMRLRKSHRLFLATHVRGVVDTLFFIHEDTGSCSSVEDNHLVLMSLNQQDQLRFYGAPSTMVKVVNKTLQAKWEKGQLSDELSGCIWTVRLKGSPWWIPDWDKDSSTNSRQLILHILSELLRSGWNVLSTANIYRGQYDKNIFILSQRVVRLDVDNERLNSPFSHFCITSHDVDRLCIAGASKSIQNILEDVLNSHWAGKVKVDTTTTSGSLEIYLEGRPWSWMPSDNGNNNVEGVALLCWFYARLADAGCTFIASADIASCTKYSPHTWIFLEEPK